MRVIIKLIYCTVTFFAHCILLYLDLVLYNRILSLRLLQLTFQLLHLTPDILQLTFDLL